ncbi:MAG: hypothetical protein KF800_06715 [Lysobacter sp.]|nr:hypothetical protein [Lysobacter sp.]
MFVPHRSLAACLLPLLLAGLAATAACAARPLDAPAHDGATRISVEHLREDFDALYAGLRAAHVDLYAHRSKTGYDALHRRMRAALDAPLTTTEARVRFQRFAAYGRVAHARVEPPMDAWETYLNGGGTAFPLFLRVIDGVVHVSDTIGEIEGVAPGDMLLAVDGRPVDAWLAPVRDLISADNDHLRDTQLETRLPLLAWLAHGSRDSFAVTVRKADGREVDAMAPARSRAEYGSLMASRVPRFELDWNARQTRMLDGGIAYLRPGPFYDNRPDATSPWDNGAFLAFVDQAFTGFIDRDARALLIDLRDNPGGDNAFSDPLLAWIADKPFRFSHRFEIRVSAQTTASNRRRLQDTGADRDSLSARFDALYRGQRNGDLVQFPIDWVQPRAGRRFEGAVFVLVNRHSYSNAVSVAAIVQDFGFGTVIGEETADLASTLGAMEQFTLPRTGIEVGYPKARILRPNGDPRPRGVVPDIAIDTPIVAGSEDEVLQRVLDIVGERRR